MAVLGFILPDFEDSLNFWDNSFNPSALEVNTFVCGAQKVAQKVATYSPGNTD